MNTYTKDPDAVLDYTVDWSDFLGADTIATSTWVVQSGLTIGTGGQAPTNDTTSATAWFSGGTLLTAYLVTSRITTVGGRTQDQSFIISIADT